MGNDPTVAEVHVEFAGRPDDTPLRCAFEPLSEKDVTQRLSALARPERTVFDAARGPTCRRHRIPTVSPLQFAGPLRRAADRSTWAEVDIHGRVRRCVSLGDSLTRANTARPQATSAMPPYRTPPTTCPLS
jgi:hypothetical protein